MMIHYMPFTYLPETLIGQLTHQLGPVAVQLPMDSLASEAMQTAGNAGLLQLQPTLGVDQAQLRQAVQAFVTWADLHQGKAGDLAGFFRTQQWKEALPKEPGTAQLRTLIRNWSDTANGERPVAPEFEAALFLVLAHTYDQQQDDLQQDFGAVQTLEKRFGKILGEADDAGPLGPCLTSQDSDPRVDRGAYMTRQRIQSWARAALKQVHDDTVFITTSPAVWDYLLDIVPEMLILDQHSALDAMSSQTEPPNMPAELTDFFKQLASAKDPCSVAADTFGAGDGRKSGLLLELAVVKGCAPDRFLSHLIHAQQDVDVALVPKEDHPNTIIGRL